MKKGYFSFDYCDTREHFILTDTQFSVIEMNFTYVARFFSKPTPQPKLFCTKLLHKPGYELHFYLVGFVQSPKMCEYSLSNPVGCPDVMFVRVLLMFLSCNKRWTIKIVSKQNVFILLVYN